MEKIIEFIKQVTAKLISIGGTIVFTVGSYTVTIYFSEQTGLKIEPASVDALLKGLLSLLAGYGMWKSGVVDNLRQIKKTTKAALVQEKSAFDLF